MKKVLVFACLALIFVACQESLEDKCARESKEYTARNCPAKMEENIILDSLTFEKATHTLHYYYRMTGSADKENALDTAAAAQILRDGLKNTTAMKVYKDNGYNFTYTYRSEKDPKIILFEVALTDKDYNSSSNSINKEQKTTSIKKDSVTWVFQSRMDEMTDSKNIWAYIRSTNYIKQKFPYEGQTYAKIIVRYMKKYGYDVLIEVDRGQIVGIDVSGTNYITARFDEGTPKNYSFDDAEDGSSEHVFLKNANGFISRCKIAKDIMIEVPMYKSGRQVFKFHVDKPLVWPN